MGKSSKQVIGYKYFAKFVIFIGNPIDKLLNINFDKRGWIANERISFGKNGEMIYVENLQLFGENEGGVAGTLRVKHGHNEQTPVVQYKRDLNAAGFQTSAYPYHSYIYFGGGGFPSNSWNLSESVLEETGDILEYMSSPISTSFYLGNTGQMKEILLWPTRIHKRNDGSPQWNDRYAAIDTSQNGVFDDEGVLESDEILIDGFKYKRYTNNINVSANAILRNSRGINLKDSKNFTFKYPSNSSQTVLIGQSGGPASNMPDYYTQTNSVLFNIQSQLNAKYVVEVHFELNNSSDKFNIQYVGDLVSTPVVEKSGDSYDITALFLTTTTEIGMIVNFSRNINNTIRANFGGTTTGRIFDIYYRMNPTVSVYDLNPVHKIREILTDDTAMNKPESMVNDVNFKKAARRMYQEGIGISCVFTDKSCIEAINEICYHIEGGVRVNRQTGLYEIVLFRDDWFATNEIHTISESKIKDMECGPVNASASINYVNVSHYDRDKMDSTSFSIAENGLIRTLNTINSEDIDLKYFHNSRNAQMIANLKLKQLSSGVWSGSFKTAVSDARKKWNRYDLLKLPWSKKWAGTILVRIMKIGLGGANDNEVSIEFTEVVPLNESLATTIVLDSPIQKPLHPEACNSKVFELTYYEAVQMNGERTVNTELADLPEGGYLCAIAEKPQNNSLYAVMYTDDGNGYERAVTVNYCETAYLNAGIDRIVSSFEVKNIGDINSIRVGSQIFINDEIMVYKSYNSETKILTVKRGAFGIPFEHSANSILYFADDFVAADSTLYVQGEQIEAKVLTTTPSGMLSLNDATTHTVTLNARAIRPYPPANVKINDEYWPDSIDVNPVITWADRNRLQQTGGEPIGWYDASVTKEEGVTYHYQIKDESENIIGSGDDVASGLVLDLEPADIFPSAKLELWSERDGFESLERVELLLISEIGLLNGFIESIYAQNEYVNLKASLTNNVVISSLTLSAGALPTGLSIIGTNITGSCSTQGSYTFTLESTDILNNIVQKTFTVKVQGVLWSQLTFDGQNMTDRVAGNTWTLGSGNTFVEGLYDGSDYALKMGGTNAPVMTKTFNQSQNFSISGLMRVETLGIMQGLIFIGDSSSNNNRDNVYIRPAGGIACFRQGGAGTGLALDADFTIEAGKTYQIGYVKNGTSRKLFVNGQLIASDIYTATVSNTSSVYVGMNRTGSVPIVSNAIFDNIVISTGSPRFE